MAERRIRKSGPPGAVGRVPAYRVAYDPVDSISNLARQRRLEANQVPNHFGAIRVSDTWIYGLFLMLKRRPRFPSVRKKLNKSSS